MREQRADHVIKLRLGKREASRQSPRTELISSKSADSSMIDARRIVRSARDPTARMRDSFLLAHVAADAQELTGTCSPRRGSKIS
jgi:hypothetical protein